MPKKGISRSRANFTDDWGNPRLTPCPHWHQGTDIFANFGTPAIATESGVVNARGNDPVEQLTLVLGRDP